MAIQTKKFTNKEIDVVPFGIDKDKFKPMNTSLCLMKKIL